MVAAVGAGAVRADARAAGARPAARLKRCRRALRRSLRAALAVPASEIYGGDPKCPTADQWCFDAVSFRATGGATQPLIHWINRPTFQQVNEIQARVPR